MTEDLWHVKLGRTVACALVSSLIAAAWPALRMAAGSGRFGTWLVLATLGLPCALLLAVFFQGARSAFDFSMNRVAAAVACVCMWLLSASVAGALFRKVTHHRALGAVTLAIGLACLLLGLLPLAKRLTVWFSGRNQWAARGVGIVSLALLAALVLLFVLRSGATAMAISGTDAMILLVVSLLVESLLPEYDRALLVLGLPMAVLVAVVGISRGLGSFPMSEAPLYGWIALKCPGVATQVPPAH